ncbi:hypothetical protein RHSIM_Rhsim04G0227300 [Rhododendron simsii]|uniref:Uncharacterized protein n=1 Tax=Rhododendron simsii TaxID=118357 RepID=A0A834GZ41_RHOSS|nr:hypothetical protein RHSIM_Rhsim04G0227300 [Rhododendron simsii]
MARLADLIKIGMESFPMLEEYTGPKKKKLPPLPPHQEVQHRCPTPFLRPVDPPTKDPVICRYRGAQSYETVAITETKHHNVGVKQVLLSADDANVLITTKSHNWSIQLPIWKDKFHRILESIQLSNKTATCSSLKAIDMILDSYPKDLAKIGMEGFAILEEFLARNKKKPPPPPPPHQEAQPRRPTAFLRPVVHPIEDPVWRNRGAKSYEVVVITETKHHNFDLVNIGKDGFAILEEFLGRNKKKPPPPPPHQEVHHGRPTPFLRPVVQPIQDPVIWRYRGAKSYEAVVVTETKMVITETKHHNFGAYGRHFAQMATQADYKHLVKVGLEGFEMVEYLKWYQKQQQKYQKKQEPQMKQEVAIDSNEAAKQFGGVGFVDFKRKPLRAVH